jgi:hypothetical protein
MRRNLHEIFSERDPTKRQVVVAEIWAPDGIFVDPDGPHIGHSEIEDTADALLRKFPDFVFSEIGGTNEIPGAVCLAWGFGRPGKASDITGIDVMMVAGSRIAALYTFVDPKPSERVVMDK